MDSGERRRLLVEALAAAPVVIEDRRLYLAGNHYWWERADDRSIEADGQVAEQVAAAQWLRKLIPECPMFYPSKGAVMLKTRLGQFEGATEFEVMAFAIIAQAAVALRLHPLQKSFPEVGRE